MASYIRSADKIRHFSPLWRTDINGIRYQYFVSIAKCLYTGWVTGTWRVLKRNKLVSLPVRRDSVSSVTGLTDAILVAMEQWAAAHRAFVIILWPADSPDFSVCDFFLWGYLKSKVNLMKLRDIIELKNAIKGEITATWWQKQWEPYVTDWKCRRDSGKHLRDVLFKK